MPGQKYAARSHTRLNVIQERRSRLGGAKNLGIENAKGKYLWFPDVDDIPSETFLKRMIDAKESTKSDLAMCNFQYTNDRRWKCPGTGEVLVMSGKTALHARSLNIIPVTSWAMLYDRQHILRNKIRFAEAMAEDIAFTYLVLDNADKVCYITVPLYGYYQNDESFCKRNKDERGMKELESYMYLSRMLPQDNLYLQNRLCLIGMRSMVHMSKKGFYRETRKDRLKIYVNRHLDLMGRMEYHFIKLFPRTYYTGVNWYINHFYCRTGKIYTDKGKMKTLNNIVDSAQD